MSILNLMLFFIIFSIGDYFIVKYEIKQNIDLFYDLHKKQVIKVLNKYDKK